VPGIQPSDEARHAPGEERWWSESYWLEFFSQDASLGGYVGLHLYPNLGASWYWACLVGEGRPLVTVIEHEAPSPRRDTLELRTSGLWSELQCETPLEHVTVGLEAFALAVDDPIDVYGDLRGVRVPLGFDLEWETDRAVTASFEDVARDGIPCRVHGEVLVDQERIDFDGWGERAHRWGAHRWWSCAWSRVGGRLGTGERVHGIDPGTAARGEEGDVGAGRDRVRIQPLFDSRGLPAACRADIGGLTLRVDPVAWAPVRVDGPDGAVSRLARGLVRLTADDGRRGAGWFDTNRPREPAGRGEPGLLQWTR
jgi:hypothetical protein